MTGFDSRFAVVALVHAHLHDAEHGHGTALITRGFKTCGDMPDNVMVARPTSETAHLDFLARQL